MLLQWLVDNPAGFIVFKLLAAFGLLTAVSVTVLGLAAAFFTDWDGPDKV